MKENNVRQVVLELATVLQKAGIEDAVFNVRCMAAEIFHCSLASLPKLWETKTDQAFEQAMHDMVSRRLKHEPLQHIIGNWSFLDFDILVGPEALIPRPETEDVFQAACQEIKNHGFPAKFSFADIGTGTGVLGIALSRAFPECFGWLSDISFRTLQLAGKNLIHVQVDHERICLIQGSLLEAFAESSLQLIISNPPYIPDGEIPSLMPEVRDYDPVLALDGGNDGLQLINKLLDQALHVLKPEGLLVFEHGHGQRNTLKRNIGRPWEIVTAGNDLSGNERFFILKNAK